MPYRALLSTLFAIMVSLLALGMWLHAAHTLLVTAQAAEQMAPAKITDQLTALPKSRPPESVGHPEAALEKVIKGTLFLALLLVFLLLLVGCFATFHQWVRLRLSDKGVKRGKRTKYVDIWKLAGERLSTPKDPDEGTSNAPPASNN